MTVPQTAPSASLPLSGIFASDSIHGTVVRMVFTEGFNGPASNVDLELYDVAWGGHSAAPISTANFLTYVNSGSYNGTFIHRAQNFLGTLGADLGSSPSAFLQGGQYTRTTDGQVGSIVTNAPINLEYASDRPNLAGTISYARTSDINSATAGFFLNVADNPGFDGPGTAHEYAVFGQVIGTSQAVLTRYGAFPRVAPSSTFQNLPVVNSSVTSQNVTVDDTIILTSASVVPNAGSAFTYAVGSSDNGIVTPSLDGNGNLVLAYGAKFGSATVTVTATDLTGATTQDTFTVSVDKPGLVASVNGAELQQDATVSLPDAHTTDDPADPHFQTITLKNTGQVDLDISDVSVPAGFTLVSSPATNVAAGSSTTLQVAVSPAATPGLVTGNLVITTNASATPLTLSLAAALERTWTLNAAHPSLTYTDADGTKATLTLKGSGTVTLGLFSSADPTTKGKTATLAGVGAVNSVTVADTTSKSSLSAAGKGGNGALSIAEFNAFSPLGSLTLAPVAITNTLVLPSATTLALASLSGSATFSGAVTTANIGAISNASLSAAALKTLTVKGNITASTLAFSGAVTTLSAASISNSALRIGITSTGTPTSAADFSGASTLGTLNLTSKSPNAFSHAYLYVATLGTAKLGTFTSADATTDALVLRSAKSVTGKGPTNKAFSLKSVSSSTSNAAILALTAASISQSRLALTVI